ncbi:MAG: hypothetical protein H6993_07055 [Pseudomonadales bacterium]|nr:hypothetical protein [Pseudomonadales bacterium]MCP5183703.1 hypothetical protein [Pseudomonadales bacterium]
MIGAIGEITAAVAVVVTLLYLGKQISQTNQITTAGGARELQQQYSHLYSLIAADPQIAELVARLRHQNYVAQSPEEDEKVESFGLLLAGIWLTTAIAYEQGQIDKTMYQIYCADVTVKLSKWPGLRPYLLNVMNKYPGGRRFEIFQPLLR